MDFAATANPERHQPNNDEQLEGMNLRLIDADAFREKVCGWFHKDIQESNEVDDLAASLIMEIDNAPTVEAAPVVHGHWESFTTSAFIGMDEDGEPKWADRRFFVHKECGRRSAIKEKYCPDCGAKMDL